jgi:hypothetical protein
MQTKYEVQHETLCQGWINTWTVDDEPEIFDTYQDAENTLKDFLKEERKAFKRGEIDSMYHRDEFRIVEVPSDWTAEKFEPILD